MTTNCPNCGAPLDLDRIKCSYCGTRYYDMAVTEKEPFYLRIKLNGGTFVAKCVMNDCRMEQSLDTIDISGGRGGLTIYSMPSYNLSIHMDMTAIKDGENFAYFIREKNCDD